MLNNITIQGRLVSEPEYRQTQSGKDVTTFTLAVSRDYDREQTDFVSCVAWAGTAQFVSKYFHKGMLAIAVGRLQSRKWEDKDGNKRTSWDVVANNVYFCEGKRDSGEGYSAGEPQYIAPKAPDVIADDQDDGEPPF